MNIADQLKSLRLPGLSLDGPGLAAWREDLGGCLPIPVRRWFARRDRRLLVLTAGSKADLFIAIGEEQEGLGTLELNGGGALLVPGDHSSPLRTVLRVPADLVLRRTVSFPLQVRENLAQVMRYEIDRLSPFSAEQVCFDFEGRVSGRADRLIVELALCRRDQVQPWLDRLREIGRPADQLTWDGAWPRANLLAPADRPSHKAALFTVNRMLGLLVLALLVAALISPLWQRKEILGRIDDDLRRVRAEAVQVDEVRKALDLAREGSVAVLRLKAEQPRMTDLLRELSQRLPDDTWIQTLDVQDGEVQLRGESARATALIELLVRMPGVDGVAFRSPVTQVPQTGMERFHIAFRYTGSNTP